MARGKIQMRRIENAASWQVTFWKRLRGLLKKAYELSVLCDAEVAVIIFSQKGRLHGFSSNSKIQKIIDRYRRSANDADTYKTNMEQYILVQLFDDKIQQLQEKERSLKEENAKLLAKCYANPWQSTPYPRVAAIHSQSSHSTDVETGLSTGLPKSLFCHHPAQI